MKNVFGKIMNSKFNWLFVLLVLIGINFIVAGWHYRFDLTKEKRYTLSKATKDLLRNLDDEVSIEVFLKGDFPAGFRKLANSADEFLQLLKDQNSSKLSYTFISPLDEIPGTNKLYGDSLADIGAVPINLTVQKKAGESSNIIFPVALIHYKDRYSLVNLYPGASGRISQEEINSAEALMEYQFIRSLNKLIQTERPILAYEVGHGEPADGRTYDLVESLKTDYEFYTFDLRQQTVIPDNIDVLMIVKPAQPFTEEDKFKLDQYIMNGGKLICFIDNLIAEQDSLSFKPETVAYDRNLNLDDLFFRYGVRINTDLVMDLQCDMIPFIVGGGIENPQYEFLHWNYFPLFEPGNSKVLNKNLGYISGRFVNSIDTVTAAEVKKTILLSSSANSRTISTPALVSLNENKNVPEDEKFRQDAIPVAVLLEGKFTSLFKGRVTQSQIDTLVAHGNEFKSNSTHDAKVIVAADGDLVLNDVVSSMGYLPMGWNKYTYAEYQRQTEYGKLFLPVANREFLMNCVEYFVNNESINQTRNKDIVLRLLDSQKIKNQKPSWQFINIGLPILLIILLGYIYQQLRKKKYSR